LLRRTRQGHPPEFFENQIWTADDRAPLICISAVEAYFRDDLIVPDPSTEGRDMTVANRNLEEELGALG
jgi:hypothetical protein